MLSSRSREWGKVVYFYILFSELGTQEVSGFWSAKTNTPNTHHGGSPASWWRENQASFQCGARLFTFNPTWKKGTEQRALQTTETAGTGHCWIGAHISGLITLAFSLSLFFFSIIITFCGFRNVWGSLLRSENRIQPGWNSADRYSCVQMQAWRRVAPGGSAGGHTDPVYHPRCPTRQCSWEKGFEN